MKPGYPKTRVTRQFSNPLTRVCKCSKTRAGLTGLVLGAMGVQLASSNFQFEIFNAESLAY